MPFEWSMVYFHDQKMATARHSSNIGFFLSILIVVAVSMAARLYFDRHTNLIARSSAEHTVRE
jgi:hypothetical protein